MGAFRLLGVEHEHHAHEHGDEARVDLVQVVRSIGPEDALPRQPVGVLEPREQLPQRGGSAAAQLVRDGVLVLAARRGAKQSSLFDSSKPQEAPLVQEHVQRAEQGPPVDGHHLREPERHPPGALPLGERRRA